ncbi:hypothetical protein ACIBKZ_26040 [Streptomyces sp. NPDC050421]
MTRTAGTGSETSAPAREQDRDRRVKILDPDLWTACQESHPSLR